MKSIVWLISLCLFTGILSGCGPAASQRIPPSPFMEDANYFGYQSYDYMYHPAYYVPRGDNVHVHR